MNKKDKSLIIKYSSDLTTSLISNLEKSTKKSLNLQSDMLDLDYSKNGINLKLSCKIIIDHKYYNISSISDFLPLYFEKLSIKNNDIEIFYKKTYEAKYRNLTKAQVKYLAFSDELIVRENLNQKLYGMEDNYVTLLGDKTMYDKNNIVESIYSNVYKTIKSKIRKIIKNNSLT